jgi:hypothetical protein
MQPGRRCPVSREPPLPGIDGTPPSRKADHMARFLILVGIVLVMLGLLWPYVLRLGLGRLPGDIVIERENFTFYVPLATCILVSLLLSGVFWLFNR